MSDDIEERVNRIGKQLYREMDAMNQLGVGDQMFFEELFQRYTRILLEELEDTDE